MKRKGSSVCVAHLGDVRFGGQQSLRTHWIKRGGCSLRTNHLGGSKGRGGLIHYSHRFALERGVGKKKKTRGWGENVVRRWELGGRVVSESFWADPLRVGRGGGMKLAWGGRKAMFSVLNGTWTLCCERKRDRGGVWGLRSQNTKWKST